MTAGHPNDAAIDFDALEDAFEPGGLRDLADQVRPDQVRPDQVRPGQVRPGQATLVNVLAPDGIPGDVVPGLGRAKQDYLSAALNEPRWSVPDSASARQVFINTAKTAGPFVLADVLSLLVAGICATLAVRFCLPQTYASIGWTPVAALALLLLAYWLGGLYSETWVHPVVELRQIVALNSVVFVSTAAGRLTSRPLLMWCGFVWTMAFVIVPLTRVLLRHGLSRFSWWGYPTLIIGSGVGADELATSLMTTPHCSLRPRLITDPAGMCRTGLLPVVNDRATLESLLHAESIRHAVVSLPQFSSSQQQHLLDRYGSLLPHLLILSDTTTLPALWGASRNSGRLSGFEVRNGRLVATMRFVKRAIDLIGGLAVLPIAAVLTVFLAAIAAVTSPGPLFYGHERIGRHGRRFKVWKFRTMHVDAARMLEEHLAASSQARIEWQRQHKLRDDPRITRLGRFLRSTSLDELPQIWNVLKGDMSLVGPRPIVQAEIPKYGSAIELYGAVKPGITGLWQVSGRTDISYSERVELDVFYIRHWSPWLDLYILAKTVVILTKESGAY